MTAELTENSYVRWLRARQPQPLGFFLGLTEDEQEVLADLGDQYTEDCNVALGYSIQDPEAVAAGSESDGAEERLARRMAGELLSRAETIRNEVAAEQPEEPSQPGMSGVTQRRAQRAFDEESESQEGKVLFGRPPDRIASVPAIDTLETAEAGDDSQ